MLVLLEEMRTSAVPGSITVGGGWLGPAWTYRGLQQCGQCSLDDFSTILSAASLKLAGLDVYSTASGLGTVAFAGSFLLWIKSFLVCVLSPGWGSASSKVVTHVMRSGEMHHPVPFAALCWCFTKTGDNCHWDGCCLWKVCHFSPVSHPDRWREMIRSSRIISIANELTFSSSYT